MVSGPYADDDEFAAEYNAEEDENTGKIFIRYLQTIIAWLHALSSLNRSKLFRSGLPLTLNIVHTPDSPQASYMLPMVDLLKEFLPFVTLGMSQENRDAIFQELLTFLRSPTSDKFSGTVHCEAILMALITAGIRRDQNLPHDIVQLLRVNLSLSC
jgi:hypothetical protein